MTLKQSEIAGYLVSQPYFTPTPDFVGYVKTMRHQPDVLARIRGLDFELMTSIVIPKELSCDPRVVDEVKKAFVTAITPRKGLTLRKRSTAALEMGQVMLKALPEYHQVPAFTADESTRRSAQVVAAGGGTEFTMGRIQMAYPRRNYTPSRPTTRGEALDALRNCGMGMDQTSDYPRPYPIYCAESGGDGPTVSANKKADNGLPVGLKWGDDDAQKMVLRIAQDLRSQMETAYRLDPEDGVTNWVRSTESKAPWLMAFTGKAKEDAYKLSKVEARQLRFYNVVPRQLLLIMQMATQPFEASARNLYSQGNSAQGITFMHGGADRFIAELSRRVDTHQFAYVHVGDDSFCIVKILEHIVMFSLDASNFDLTQHAATTKEIHRVLRAELERIDPVSAQLWHALMRERLVVTFDAIVLKWKHGGPSGMALQSKVNDMLMEVLLSRLFYPEDLAETRWVDQHAVEIAAHQVGKSMGFSVRLEDHFVVRAQSLEEALAIQPYLFIGYFLHHREGMGMACFDIPRTIARIAYPNLGYDKNKQEFEKAEAIRLGSMTINFGIPPVECDEAFTQARTFAAELVAIVLSKYGDITDERLAWAIRDNPVASYTASSLSGLLAAMQRDPRELWLKEKGISTMAPLLTNWADVMDEEYEENAGHREVLPQAPGKLPPPLKVRIPPKAPTHPATEKNAGRPPPTAVWGPDRPPRPERDSSGASTSRPRGRRAVDKSFLGGYLEEELSTIFSDEEISELDEWLEKDYQERESKQDEDFHEEFERRFKSGY